MARLATTLACYTHCDIGKYTTYYGMNGGSVQKIIFRKLDFFPGPLMSTEWSLISFARFCAVFLEVRAAELPRKLVTKPID